jgi:hypothetical protein
VGLATVLLVLVLSFTTVEGPVPPVELLTLYSQVHHTRLRLRGREATLEEVAGMIDLLESYGRRGYGVEPLIEDLERLAIEAFELDADVVRVVWTDNTADNLVVVVRENNKVLLRAGPGTPAALVREVAEDELDRWELAAFSNAAHTHSNGVTHRHPERHHRYLEEILADQTGTELGSEEWREHLRERLGDHTG